MIYFIQPAEGGPIKIGTTENLGVRLHQLEAHYGKPFAVLATRPGGRAEERAIHVRFDHLRFGKTEQFRPAPDLMEFIGRPLLVAANPETVEAAPPRRTGTEGIRLALDVIDLAWKCAPYHGYRGPGAAGRFLGDFLRPILIDMERDLVARRMEELGLGQPEGLTS